MKNLVQRTCMGCNQKKDKNQLLRIVKNKNREILIDLNEKLDGRGAYICKDEKCLDKVIKSKRIDKLFKIMISEDIYNELRGVIIDK